MPSRRVPRFVALAVCCVAVITGLSGVIVAAADAAPWPCTEPQPASIARDEPLVPGDRPLLTREATEQVVALGDSTARAGHYIRYAVREAALPEAPLCFTPGPFRRGNRELGQEAFSVSVIRIEDDAVTVRLGIEPEKSTGGIPPGRYQGSVQIADPRLRGQDVPVTLTKQASNVDTVAWVFTPLAVLIGLLGAWLTNQQIRQRPLRAGDLTEWIRQPGVLFALAGAAAASFLIWDRNASADPIFGEQGKDYLFLLGAMVAAAYGALTAGSAVKANPSLHTEPRQTPGRPRSVENLPVPVGASGRSLVG